MRVLVPVFIIAIIVVGIIIVVVLKAAKDARLGKFEALQEERNLYRNLYKLTRNELKTIVDTDGEGAAFTAQLALDDADAQIGCYNEKKELESA